MIALTKQDFLDLLKTVYPSDFIDSYGQGNAIFDVYAKLFSEALTKVISNMAEGLFLTADGAALELLSSGERNILRSAGQSDDALSALARAFPDTMTPQAMVNQSNRCLVIAGYNPDAAYYDRQVYPGFYADTQTQAVVLGLTGNFTEIDPFTLDEVPISAADGGARVWSGGMYFIIVVPLHLIASLVGFFADSPDTIPDPILGTDPMPISAADFTVTVQGSLTGVPVDGSQLIPDLGVYNAIWNAVNRTKPAGSGFDLIVGTYT